jgi:HSP20 family protein
MTIRDLIPWGREDYRTPAVYRDSDRDPFLSLHRQVNRLFDDVFRGFDTDLPVLGGRTGGAWPSVEIADTEKDIRVSAEVPGMEEKDIEVLLENGVLTLRGERKSETEDKERQFSERYYGRFERRIPLGSEIDEDKVSADFKNGVLTVSLPKTERARAKAKRIAINGKN